MSDTSSHHRVNDILLAPLERPALRWLAAHQPAWVTPDILTFTGFLGAALIFVSYVLSAYDKNALWLANLGFLVNWYGDSLDGTLARFRHIERPKYGYFLDHTVDAVGETLIFLGLGLSPYMRFDVASLLLISYLLMSILVFLRTSLRGVFQISYIRLGPTEMRLIAVLCNMGVFFFGNPLVRLPFGWALTIFDLIGVLLTVLLFGIYLVMLVTQARELARLESAPPP